MAILSHKQIECYLTHKNPEVRAQWAGRMDYTPTAKQIERGLADEHEWVRKVWAKRMDYTPTLEQSLSCDVKKEEQDDLDFDEPGLGYERTPGM